MTVRNLEHLFAPSSIAVIGASRRAQKVGGVVMRNLLRGGFDGPIMPVNPKYDAVAGVLAYPDVPSLPVAPDLAVICTPPATVPAIVRALRDRGNRAVIVLTAGLDGAPPAGGQTLVQQMLDEAKPATMRILGPNCVGLLSPGIGLNASFAQTHADPGHLAFVSQSGALCTVVLDWAIANGVGFSHFVSLGNACDVDFGDVIDYLGSDPNTRGILLYIESIPSGRKFLSAARAASRNKPIVAIKAGRGREGARAAASHTGALAGSDDVMDYALRRAGILRVDGIDELFNAVETLARAKQPRGDRLLIVTNGGGPGVMAADALVAGGASLAPLADETLQALDAVLPSNWSRANPVDIIGDATAERFQQALRIARSEAGADAILVLYAPTALADSTAAAQAVVDEVQTGQVVLTSWLGQQTVTSARRLLVAAGVPTYDTPGDAVSAFLYMVRYRHNRELLAETPASMSSALLVDRVAARGLIEGALRRGDEWLDSSEATRLLAAYGVPVVETRSVADAAAAVAAAEELGFPVAVKVRSQQIVHKTDLGAVRLDLENGDAVAAAIADMRERIGRLQPDARIDGYLVQRMARRPGAHELLVGAAVDPLFGPFLMFGQGGIAVEVVADSAVAIPPLNSVLARELMASTRIWRLLQGYRGRPAADLDAIVRVLLQVSQLIVDHPEIVELDVNPLLADAADVLALDARVRLRATSAGATARLAIRPYPQELEERWHLDHGLDVLVRPIRPEDEPAHLEFFGRLQPEDVRFRFFSQIREMPHSQIARYTQIDYDREMAFVAVREAEGDQTLGVVRAVTDPDNEGAEFAIILRSDLTGKGLGRRLLAKMIAYCRGRGTAVLTGRVLRNNVRMLGLARELGFTAATAPDSPDQVEVRLQLQQ